MDLIPFLVAGILVIGMGYIAWRKTRREAEWARHNLNFSADGGLVTIGASVPSGGIRLLGVGEQTSEMFDLDAGPVRLRHDLPDDVSARVDLLDADDRPCLSIEVSGAGEQPLSAPTSASYRLRLSPTDAAAGWEVEISLPG